MVDYEKKYKDALGMAEEIIRYYKEHNRGDETSIEDLEQIFPELKESKDERIRNRILLSLEKDLMATKNSGCDTQDLEQCIAWLEKQGKQKPIKEHDACEFCEDRYGCVSPCSMKLIEEEKPNNKVEQKPILDFKARNWYVSKVDGKIHDLTYNPTDKVEPKFKVGDWVMLDRPVLITKVEDMPYNTHQYWISDGTWFGDATKSKLWTIQDAKDGDVLASDNSIFIFQEEYIAEKPIAYCGLMNGLFIKGEDACWTNEKCHPATKEQRDLLFQEMKEAGYEWDAKKKELKKIEDEIEIPFGAKDSELKEVTYYIPKGFHAEIDDDKVVIKKGEKPAAWSDEDDYNLQCMIAKVTSDIQKGNVGRNNELIDWLKSLKDRVQPKQEWSEEDENMANDLIEGCLSSEKTHYLVHTSKEVSDWLKSIKDRM